jgi:hypothetical protein
LQAWRALLPAAFRAAVRHMWLAWQLSFARNTQTGPLQPSNQVILLHLQLWKQFDSSSARPGSFIQQNGNMIANVM